MSRRSRLLELPEELLVMIASHLARTRGVSTVSILNRRFYRISNNLIVDRAVNKIYLGRHFYRTPSEPLLEALRYDSLFGTIERSHGVVRTFLLAALLHDAPHVASDLLEKGAKLFHQNRTMVEPVLG
ncbi:hypothetical protein PG988_001167 [Apiospora saccharicola]